jgi:hypothetical protein
MRAASSPISFSLRNLASAMFQRRARPSRLAVVYLLFTVALVMVPKADIPETPFDEANTSTNEVLVEQAASEWERRQPVTVFVPRLLAQPQTCVRRIFRVYAGWLSNSRTFRELICSLLC